MIHPNITQKTVEKIAPSCYTAYVLLKTHKRGKMAQGHAHFSEIFNAQWSIYDEGQPADLQITAVPDTEAESFKVILEPANDDRQHLVSNIHTADTLHRTFLLLEKSDEEAAIFLHHILKTNRVEALVSPESLQEIAALGHLAILDPVAA